MQHGEQTKHVEVCCEMMEDRNKQIIHLDSHKPLSQNRLLTDVGEPSFLTFVDLGRSTQKVGVYYTRAHVQWLILNRVSELEACLPASEIRINHSLTGLYAPLSWLICFSSTLSRALVGSMLGGTFEGMTSSSRIIFT